MRKKFSSCSGMYEAQFKDTAVNIYTHSGRNDLFLKHRTNVLYNNNTRQEFLHMVLLLFSSSLTLCCSPPRGKVKSRCSPLLQMRCFCACYLPTADGRACIGSIPSRWEVGKGTFPMSSHNCGWPGTEPSPYNSYEAESFRVSKFRI
jgi:hypothetical protein